MELPEEMRSHYGQAGEQTRLQSPVGQVEFRRTLSIIQRFGPAVPARVLDVGGGAGVYSFELARQGHSVDLLDAVPLHIQQAREDPNASALRSIEVGDARRLDHADNQFDLVLLLGPLYHLTSRLDRIEALKEAKRVLRPGGIVLVAAISRFASMLDGFFHGHVHDPVFREIVEKDLIDGQHRNPTDDPTYFTNAKFHSISELEEEVIESQLAIIQTVGVEGFGWLLDQQQLQSGDKAYLMNVLERVESEREILGVSAHIIVVAQKPASAG